MKALRFHEFGGPEVLSYDDAPIPEPGPGQVQVKVSGAGVNPIDWKIREGYLQAIFPTELPSIVGREFSGTISKLGDGVSEYSVGDQIYGIAITGATAEYAVADLGSIAHKPFSMDLPDAASVPLTGMTAWQALFDVANLQTGQKILIHGASGGVGTFAIQFAKWKGAHVIGTSSKRNHHLLMEMGADELIDYQTTDFTEVLTDIDVVLDAVGGEESGLKALSVLKPGGILVSIAGVSPTDEAESQGKRAVNCRMQANPVDLKHIADLIQDLIVRPIIDAVVPYNRAIDAQKESQNGHVVGKLVVDVTR